MALLLAYCFGMVGYHMLIFSSGIERISDEYFEAATLDGANNMQIFGAGNSVTERNSGIGAAVGVMLSVCVVAVFWLCNHLLKDDDLEF